MSTLPPAETARRLRLLADTLDTVSNVRFNMRTWVNRPGLFDQYGCRLEQDRPITLDDFANCGTSACALGWAYTVDEFRELGLELTENGLLRFSYDGYTYCSEEAGAKLFGIRWSEADRLFCSNFGATPAMKAEELRRLAAIYDSKKDSMEDAPGDERVQPSPFLGEP